MTTLLIEPFGGLAGDMLLAALLDLGDARFTLAQLSELAGALVPGECSLEATRTHRGGIGATHLAVRTVETDTIPHRHFDELERLVRACQVLSPRGRERALSALWRIAVAEGKVHGLDPREVHLHEVGAVDTLVDVCGAALAFERLGIDEVLATPPLLGSGTVRCAHGELPVPTPAVVALLAGAPTRAGGGGERLTPTGAALLAEWVEAWEPTRLFTSLACGYGAGTRDPAQGPPNLCRVQLGAHRGGGRRVEAWQLDCNLDDATGEELSHAMAGLFAAGALDVWCSPVTMKKGRPGVVLSALCRRAGREALEAVLFERTPTLGLRWTRVERTELGRDRLVVEVEGRAVRVKVRRVPGREGAPGDLDLSPEHDDLARLAAELGIGLREAERRASAAARAQLDAPGAGRAQGT